MTNCCKKFGASSLESKLWCHNLGSEQFVWVTSRSLITRLVWKQNNPQLSYTPDLESFVQELGLNFLVCCEFRANTSGYQTRATEKSLVYNLKEEFCHCGRMLPDTIVKELMRSVELNAFKAAFSSRAFPDVRGLATTQFCNLRIMVVMRTLE